MDRAKVAAECEKIDRAGGDVLKYLREKYGVISDRGTWFRLQKEELKRKDRELTEGRGGDGMNRFTMDRYALTDMCIEAVRHGENPIEKLAAIGYKTPATKWQSLRRWLKDNDPEKYAELPEDIRAWNRDQKKEHLTAEKPEAKKKPAAKKAKAGKKEAAKEEAPAEEPGSVLPSFFSGYRITAVDTTYGEFRYSREYNVVEWSMPDGTAFTLSPEEWKELAEEVFPALMDIFGIREAKA